MDISQLNTDSDSSSDNSDSSSDNSDSSGYNSDSSSNYSYDSDDTMTVEEWLNALYGRPIPIHTEAELIAFEHELNKIHVTPDQNESD